MTIQRSSDLREALQQGELATANPAPVSTQSDQPDQTTSQKALTIVMPAYQEAKTIATAIQRVQACVQPQWPDLQILVVSDGSTDGTEQVVLDMHDPAVRCLAYSRNRGKGHAITAGVREATADFIAIMDADLDIDPISLVWLLELLQESQADVVIGSKIHANSIVEYPRLRRLLSSGFRQLTKTLFDLNITDTQTGVKVFRRERLLRALTLVTTNGWAFDLHLLVVMSDQGSAIVEGPVKIDYQFTSTVPPSAALTMALDAMRIARQRSHAAKP